MQSIVVMDALLENAKHQPAPQMVALAHMIQIAAQANAREKPREGQNIVVPQVVMTITSKVVLRVAQPQRLAI